MFFKEYIELTPSVQFFYVIWEQLLALIGLIICGICVSQVQGVQMWALAWIILVIWLLSIFRIYFDIIPFERRVLERVKKNALSLKYRLAVFLRLRARDRVVRPNPLKREMRARYIIHLFLRVRRNDSIKVPHFYYFWYFLWFNDFKLIIDLKSTRINWLIISEHLHLKYN